MSCHAVRVCEYVTEEKYRNDIEYKTMQKQNLIQYNCGTELVVGLYCMHIY